MNLHENNEAFKIFIENAAIYFDIKNRSIVEKDYYVTTFLKKLTEIQTDLIFKGGTSLSKAHKIIKRFSEDIDISLRSQTDKPTNTQKRDLDENIKAITKKLGLKLNNPVNDPDRRDFIRYFIEYIPAFPSKTIKSFVLVEASFFMKAFPEEILPVSSLVHDFMFAHDGGREEIEKYGLQPFMVPVQSMERTFIDKVFAVLDYHLENKQPNTYENKIKDKSRHIYDLYKLYPKIKMDDEFTKLINEVYRIRKIYCDGLSTRLKINFHDELKEIITDGVYRFDYDKVTKTELLQENVPYSEAITVLSKIIEDGHFDFPKK